MHEVLAPILFVVYFDHHSFERLNAQNCLVGLNEVDLNALRVINNPKYLEHDAYALFRQLIKLIEDWYVTDDENEQESSNEPFAR
jgi:TBC1 domain family protein 5